MRHEKKITQQQYNKLLDGSEKTILCNSDAWKEGDWVLFREYDWKRGKYTGSELLARITSMEMKPVFDIAIMTVLL